MAAHYTNFRQPEPLNVTGSEIAENWQRFRDQWENYVLAADLSEASEDKRAAVFLTCIGTAAYDVYRCFDLAADEKRKLNRIIEEFDTFCIGSVNTTYERYRFNQRVQDNGERFDVFLGDVRRLARTCQFGAVEESLIRDRLVIGIRSDSTRQKMLQIRDLTLKRAIDLCKASEMAEQQLKSMTESEQIHTLAHRTGSSGQPRPRINRSDGQVRANACHYCGRTHAPDRQSCPAFGKTCRRCSKPHHFQAQCKAKMVSQKFRKPEVCQLEQEDEEDDEELLTLYAGRKDRWFTELQVAGTKVTFLLDTGASCNLLAEATIRELGRLRDIRPAGATLRMYDKTVLPTRGMITLPVCHPRTATRRTMDFYVAATHEQPILGFQACRDLQLVRVAEEDLCENTACPAETPTCMTEAEVTSEYADLFDGVGLLEGDIHLEVDETVRPTQMPLRRLPLGVRNKVAEELQRLVNNGIIAPVSEPTPWVSALLVVAKPDGRIRICVDPKPLNKALARSHYRMPTIDDVLPQLTGAKVFSTVDAKDGFWHLRLDESSSRLTTFETPYGRYRWQRLPFGLNVSPELFQSRIHMALSGLTGIACIADDILISGTGATEAEAIASHNSNLRGLLDRCREKGIKLNKKKLQLNRPSTIFCGHELTKLGVRADQRKVLAIQNIPPPSDRQGVLRLLGMSTYLAKFCPHFSECTAPIRELLKAGNAFCWRPDTHGEALQKLKRMLSEAPVLAFFDTSKPIVIQCDASQAGLGAVLLQAGRPVEYASRAMTETETHYAQIEKEMLAIVFALERFHTYVYGTPVEVQTDHKPLIAIHKKPLASAPKRLQRMLLRLQRYDFTPVYTPGCKVILADTLSRAYAPLTTDENPPDAEFAEELATISDKQQMEDLQMVASQDTVDRIKATAAADESYQLLIKQIQRGWPDNIEQVPESIRLYKGFADELIVCDGLVFKGRRVVIPTQARPDILKRLHSSHMGINSCQRRAKESVYFPGISSEIKATVSRCEICARVQSENQKEPLKPYPVPPRPWDTVGVDVFTHHGRDFLIIVDYLSNYCEVDRLQSKKIKDITYALRAQFARHGIPMVVVSDNSPFASAEFQAFADRWQFTTKTSSPRYAQSNGKAEAAVKTVKRLMTKAAESGTDPFLALLDFRNTPSEQLGLSPAQLLFNRRTRSLLPMAAALLETPSTADCSNGAGSS